MTEWTSWFNIDHPGGNGDYERLEAIRFYYRERVCARPVAMEVRTTDWVPASDTGEVVHSSLEKGFWCINKEQPYGRICSNYHVRFQCPPGTINQATGHGILPHAMNCIVKKEMDQCMFILEMIKYIGLNCLLFFHFFSSNILDKLE